MKRFVAVLFGAIVAPMVLHAANIWYDIVPEESLPVATAEADSPVSVEASFVDGLAETAGDLDARFRSWWFSNAGKLTTFPPTGFLLFLR